MYNEPEYEVDSKGQPVSLTPNFPTTESDTVSREPSVIKEPSVAIEDPSNEAPAEEASTPKEESPSSVPAKDPSTELEITKRSIHISNLHPKTSVEELESHFSSCGAISRTTIRKDKFGKSKGFAYIEFSSEKSVESALSMEGSVLGGKKLRVNVKRINHPGMGRKRGIKRRMMPMGMPMQMPMMPMGMMGMMRGMMGWRGRGRGGFKRQKRD